MNNIRKSGRFSFRSNKRYNHSRTNNTYTHSKLRSKGNIPMLYEKYIKLAKEASSAGDRIQAEYYHQFADHYSRVMSEDGIKTSDNENTNNKTLNKEFIEDANTSNDQDKTKSSTNSDNKSSIKTDNKDDIDESENSLDTVSFIAQPVRKTEKLKK